jgi:pyruvate dehydrogenase kinase 2/3/4
LQDFPYIPAHIYFICFELLKNSMRAVVETHAKATRLPPIRVVVAEGEEDLAIKISDEGGGIARSGVPYIWTYLYSTAKLPADAAMTPLAGYGCGLPLARVYARYFGGDLSVVSIERFGTDAYVFLKRAAAGASEKLPASMVGGHHS